MPASSIKTRRKPTPPEQVSRDSIDGRFGTIDFLVVRTAKRKRTMGLRVLGQVVEVRAPLRTSQKAIRDFVHAKREWVRDKLIENRNRPVIPPFGHGDTVPYMGRDTSLWIEEGPVKAVVVQLHGEDCEYPDTDPMRIYVATKHFHVTTPTGFAQTADRDSIREALTAWYRAQAEEVIKAEVAEWRPIVAPRAKPVVQISNARAQWGSCSAAGVLRFSWRCMMLRDYEIAYIAVHELVHLKVRNHSKAFWRAVAKAYGDSVMNVRASIRQTARTLPR